DRGEGRAVSQRAKREANVGGELLEPPRAALITRLFLMVFDAAEFPEGGGARAAARHTATDVRGGFALDVVAHLVVEVSLDVVAVRQRPESKRHAVLQSLRRHVTH